MARPLAVSRPRPIAWPWWRHAGPARVAIGPDGRTLASAGVDGVLRLGDLELGAATFTVDLGGPVAALALTASVAVVAVGTEVLLVHAHGGQVQRRLELGADVVAVAAAADGATVAAITAASLVRARVATGRRTFEAALPCRGSALALGGDGVAVVGADDGQLVAIGAEGQVVELGRVGGATRVLRHGAGGWLALTADGRVVDVRRHAVVQGTWSALDVDRDRLVVGGARGWGIAGRAGDVLPRGVLPIADVALHPDGAHLALVTTDGAVGLVPS